MREADPYFVSVEACDTGAFAVSNVVYASATAFGLAATLSAAVGAVSSSFVYTYLSVVFT